MGLGASVMTLKTARFPGRIILAEVVLSLWPAPGQPGPGRLEAAT